MNQFYIYGFKKNMETDKWTFQKQRYSKNEGKKLKTLEILT